MRGFSLILVLLIFALFEFNLFGSVIVHVPSGNKISSEEQISAEAVIRYSSKVNGCGDEKVYAQAWSEFRSGTDYRLPRGGYVVSQANNEEVGDKQRPGVITRVHIPTVSGETKTDGEISIRATLDEVFSVDKAFSVLKKHILSRGMFQCPNESTLFLNDDVVKFIGITGLLKVCFDKRAVHVTVSDSFRLSLQDVVPLFDPGIQNEIAVPTSGGGRRASEAIKQRVNGVLLNEIIQDIQKYKQKDQTEFQKHTDFLDERHNFLRFFCDDNYLALCLTEWYSNKYGRNWWLALASVVGLGIFLWKFWPASLRFKFLPFS
jgi:hypothetical protein